MLACAVGVACGPGERTASRTIQPFLDAVQHEDLAALYCLVAGAANAEEPGTDERGRRESFEAWARERLAAYDVGRDEGWVDPGDRGIELVKLLALGRGTFFELGSVRVPEPGVLRVRMDLRLGYHAMDLSPFSPGTTFYVCGVPLGRVHVIRKPAGEGEESAEVLDGLSVDWTIVREDAGGGCPARWTVASVVPVSDSATSRRVTWVF